MKNGITGIVLAGGKSSRMGRDKGFTTLLGKPLVSYSIETLKRAGCSVVISANDGTYEIFGYPLTADKISGIGPMGGIYSALQASRTDINAVLSCDVPLVPSELFTLLLEKSYKYQAIVPVFKGHPEPLCGCYRKEITKKIEERIARKNYNVQSLLNVLKTNFIEITPELSFYREGMFANINDPGKLSEIETILKE